MTKVDGAVAVDADRRSIRQGAGLFGTWPVHCAVTVVVDPVTALGRVHHAGAPDVVIENVGCGRSIGPFPAGRLADHIAWVCEGRRICAAEYFKHRLSAAPGQDQFAGTRSGVGDHGNSVHLGLADSMASENHQAAGK